MTSGSRVFSLLGARIFDGVRILEDRAVVVDGERVVGLVPLSAAVGRRIALDGLLLSPGFVDWQVNGGGGALFNSEPTVEGIAAIASTHARFGATALLPTLITDRPDVARAAAQAMAEAIRRRTPGVVGIHFEGPHLSAARRGAHDGALIRPMTRADRDLLAGPGMGVVVATVASEGAAVDDVRALARAGVRVSLGHTDASYAEAMALFDAGAVAATHLFNAMAPLHHREPGLLAAALERADVWAGLIADGWHVHPAALRVAVRAKAGGRLTLVTDAMPTVGGASDAFLLNGRAVRRKNGRLTLENGALAGSDLDMASAVRFMVTRAGVSLDRALAMATSRPARFLGLRDRGRLAPGALADIVALDDALAVRRVWIGGGELPGRDG